jgi:uncharacterized protein YggE
MNSKWSSVLIGGVVAAMIVAAGAIGAIFARPGVTQAAQTVGGSVVRQITVIGTGEVKGAPDQATVQLGVQSQAQTSSAALADNNTKMEALIAKLKELGIADKDIQTSNFSISPTYGDDGQTVTGYQVNNSASVTIRDIASTGTLLDSVVEAGSNSIYGISFGIGDSKALQGEARNAAIADAKVQAEAMAKAAGGSVGQILSITESIGSAPQPMFLRAEAMMADAKAVPIAQGEQAVSAQVQITYELR